MLFRSAFLVHFDKATFRRRGTDWYSDNYDGAQRKVRLKLNGALGGLSITRDAK